MILGKIIGNVITVIKDKKYKGLKLLIVREVDMNGNYKKNFFISVDLIGAGIGEIVMVVNGTSARSSEETKDKGLDSIIVAKIENLFFKNREVSL